MCVWVRAGHPPNTFLTTPILCPFLQIWVFNNEYTQYMPLPIHELQSLVGQPAMYVDPVGFLHLEGTRV